MTVRPRCAYTENMFPNSIHLSLFDISLKLKEMWLYERDSHAPSVISEPAGKQW